MHPYLAELLARARGEELRERAARWRARRPKRRFEVPVEAHVGPGLEEVADDLCRWARSLPWVKEMPPIEGDHFGRSFAVECPLLRCREPWFALSALGHGLELGPEVLVVLPDRLAQRGDAHGWAVSLARLDDERAITAVALPTSGSELRAVQRLLAIAYSAAFPPARPLREAGRADGGGRR